MTNPIITTKCSGCGKAITAREDSANEGRCDVCLELDREAAVHLAAAPERPWWLSPWWMGVEGTACVAAVITGALMLYLAHDFPLLPGWWVAIGVALVVLGPANIALSAALWLMHHDYDPSAERASLVRWLVLAHIVISVMLFPLLIIGILLVAALYAKRGEEEAAERTIDLLGGALIGAVVDRPRHHPGICALCGRDTSCEGVALCHSCVALGKQRPAPRLLYGGRLAGVDGADAGARNAYLFVRRKPGWRNYFGGWHVILDEHDIGTLTRGQERRFEVTPGSHRVKVKVTILTPLTSNEIEFTGDQRGVFLECGRDNAQSCRLTRVDAPPYRFDAHDSSHPNMMDAVS